MLKPINHRVREQEIVEILETCVFPDPERLEQVVAEYENNPELRLYGYESEEEIVGVIGFERMDGGDDLLIRHLAVKPECRGAGFGRGQILELIEMAKPRLVAAETDEEAVEFYRRIGFEIESLGERYPGVERYRCTYRAAE
ncbi:GNAT family N-acetyltransferase [Paenibacillus sp.]|uniref:GNAT family N-acetyltransferase n=1 Tax=Paenibacillus sp. TaxID=58172 RepID=UPI002810F598|nr:GNAT family N-acetyltransferase [Paenibacillus sp.]